MFCFNAAKIAALVSLPSRSTPMRDCFRASHHIVRLASQSRSSGLSVGTVARDEGFSGKTTVRHCKDLHIWTVSPRGERVSIDANDGAFRG